MWARMTKQWMTNPDIQILSGFNPSEKITGDIVIVNYEILADQWSKKKKTVSKRGWLKALRELKPKAIVIDEIHNIMHSSAKQTIAVKMLAKRCQSIVELGGTLILNRPMEAYNAIKLIDPTIVPATRFEYGMKYCNGRHNGFGWVFSGASNIEELHQRLNKIMIRRMKQDVLKDLPPKFRTVVPLEISNREEYDSAEDDFIEWVRTNRGPKAAKRASNAEALTRVEVLKQISARGKLKLAIQWIEDFLDRGQKLVVFTTHTMILEKVYSYFSDQAVKLAGGMSPDAIQLAVDRFQNRAKVRLLVGMLDVRGRPAGVGHTLTAASSTAFLELPWSPGVCDQAEDRVYRIGQTADNVNAYYLIGHNTIENKVIDMIDKKRQVIDAVLDGKITAEESLLTELLNQYV